MVVGGLWSLGAEGRLRPPGRFLRCLKHAVFIRRAADCWASLWQIGREETRQIGTGGAHPQVGGGALWGIGQEWRGSVVECARPLALWPPGPESGGGPPQSATRARPRPRCPAREPPTCGCTVWSRPHDEILRSGCQQGRGCRVGRGGTPGCKAGETPRAAPLALHKARHRASLALTGPPAPFRHCSCSRLTLDQDDTEPDNGGPAARPEVVVAAR